MTANIKRPPYDPQVAATLAYMESQSPIPSVVPEMIPALRSAPA